MARMIQPPVLDERMDPCFGKFTIPDSFGQSRCAAQKGLSFFNGTFRDTRMAGAEINHGFKLSLPWLLPNNGSCGIANNFEAFANVVSRLHQHLLDANVEATYTEYLYLMKVEVEQHLNKLNAGIRAFKSYNLSHSNDGNGCCSGLCRDGKLTEIDEGFSSLKLLLAMVFQHIREMVSLVSTSIHELQWEHELQSEVTGIIIGDCIRGLQDELERKFYEQSSIVNSLRKNWQETLTQCAFIREELIAISNMLLPPEDESHISQSEHESPGNKSDRWKFSFFGKNVSMENGNSATQKSISPSEVISERSDFRHLNGMSRQEMLKYFRAEISKLKRLHELEVQERTEELFKFKREKWSLAIRYDIEFEPLRKKFPEVISRFDQIMSYKIAAPTICSTGALDERSRLNSIIDSLYSENRHLRGLLAEKTKNVQELSCQLSDANRKISLQYSLQKQVLRQFNNIEAEYEDLYVESAIRDEIYQVITREMVDNYRSVMKDNVQNFHAEVSSLEATLLEKDKALCSAIDENQKLKEKLSTLGKEHFIQNNQQASELIKQESEEMILRDIEMEPHIPTQRSYEISYQDMQYDDLNKLNQTLEIASTTLKEVEMNQMDYSKILGKNEQEKQLDCILASIMDLSKDFVDIEHKISDDDVQRNEKKTENLNDRCNHMVQQAMY